MMQYFRNYILLFGFLFLFVSLKAQILSERAEVSVISFGPGTEVYSIWGHTAIRIFDPLKGIDKVYNYGTYNFDTPNFLMKFIRGKLDYTLSIQRYRRVVAAYKKEQRWIREQVLSIKHNEKEKLYTLLEENYKPENRYYKYDWLFDNCATRPLEIIEKSLDSQLLFEEEYLRTYRNILDEQLINNPWTDFGIDLVIGAIADRQADPRQQMFMPDYIYDYFGKASLESEKGNNFVRKEIEIAEEGPLDWSTLPTLFQPFSVFLILFIIEILIFLVILKRKELWLKWYDSLWFIILSFGTFLLLFLWFATDHIPTKQNWNLWWMSPLFILMLPFIKENFRKKTAKIIFILLATFLLAWFIIPQQFHLAILPLIGILGIKTYKYAFLRFS